MSPSNNALLRIEPQKGKKGRTFEVALFNYARADSLWDCGTSDYARPVYIAFAGSDQEARAFAANLRTGRKCLVLNRHGHEEEKLECLRSAGYQWVFQRVGEGATVVTGYLKELFELDPGLLPPRVSFLFAPPTWWVREQAAALINGADAAKLARWSRERGAEEEVVASYFAAYLDRRIPLPIINDIGFHLALWREAQQRPWFGRGSGTAWKPGPLYVFPPPLVGLRDFVIVSAPRATVEEFVYEQTRAWLQRERPAHLLFDPEPLAEQQPAEEAEAEAADVPLPPPPAVTPRPPAQLSLFD